jgi:hypothetical protein
MAKADGYCRMGIKCGCLGFPCVFHGDIPLRELDESK